MPAVAAFFSLFLSLFNLLMKPILIVSFVASVLLSHPGFADDPGLRIEPEFVGTTKAAAQVIAPGLDVAVAGLPVNALRVDLPPLSSDERAAVFSAKEPPRDGLKALQVGIARQLDTSGEAADAARLQWHVQPDGSALARMEVSSPGASALRAGLSITELPREARFWFYGNGSDAQRLGPLTGESLAKSPLYWSPVVSGDVLTIEILLPPGVLTGAVRFDVAQVSHLFRGIGPDSMKSTGIGASNGCGLDLVCLPPNEAMRAAASAVARIIFSKDGNSYLCSGTLLADRDPTTQVPYFLTANHCVPDAASASTINTFWFFEAVACGWPAAPNMQQQFGGASLLYTDVDIDNTLVRLNDTPPAGVMMAGLDANPVSFATAAIGIHHPKGDLKKVSKGAILGYGDFNGQGSYVEVEWNSGVTEGGSSGSGIFTFNNGAYYLRGALKGGSSYCDNPVGHDLYSRLDLAWPVLKPFLGLEAGNPVTVIEFFHSGFNHFFMSSSADEIAALDSGKTAGWVRTGQSFQAYSAAGKGVSEVCRFFSASFSPKSSHFYTLDSAECAFVKQNPRWLYEGAAFYSEIPDAAGACAAGAAPLYRLYNNGMGGAPNHRYTTSLSIRSQMVSAGWLAEGAGLAGAVACVR